MKRFALLVFGGLSAIVVALSASAPAALAATNSPGSGQALEIAPPVMTLSGNPGQTIKTQVNLRDISSSKLYVSAEINDFVAAGEDGTPKILLEGAGENPYSLKSWVGPIPSLLMIPKQIRTLPVSITIPANASPGGHYGVIRFTATPPELRGTGVSLSASLGTLVLLTVNGKAKEGIAIQSFSVNHNGKSGSFFESTPLQFVTRLKNTGNIHEQPAGQITVKDMFGRKVATVNVNLPPRNILPDSVRRFDSPLDSSVIGTKKLFGRYKAELHVTYGSGNQSVTKSVTFWVLPYRLILVAIATLIGGFFGLRYLIKRYNQHIIRSSQKSRRR